MTDERSEPTLGELAGRYHEPPETPREEMWAEIRWGLESGEGVRAADPGPGPSHSRGTCRTPGGARTLWRWGWAAAALLVLGVGIGRWTAAPDAGGGEPARSPGPVAGTRTAPERAPVRQLAYGHLTTAASFLTGVRADARRGEMDPELASWARELLIQTRLLMDSPLADDPELGPLLADLELLLVQVTRAAEAQRGDEGRGREELEILTRGMDESDMNLRIDAVLPASAGMIGT